MTPSGHLAVRSVGSLAVGAADATICSARRSIVAHAPFRLIGTFSDEDARNRFVVPVFDPGDTRILMRP